MAGLSAKELKRLDTKVKAIEEKNKRRQRMADRIDNWVYGALMLFYVVMFVVLVSSDKPSQALFIVCLMGWAAFTFVLNRQINYQHYVIRMQTGLRKLTDEELELAMKEGKAKAVARKKEAAK